MGNRYALLIGNSEYEDPTLRKLKAPDADVRALVDLLKVPEIGGYDVQHHLNTEFHKLQRIIGKFLTERQPDDFVLLYFSGHGILDASGELWLALKDTEKDLLTATGIGASWLKKQMNFCRAHQQVLLLDCCYSGAFSEGEKGEDPLNKQVIVNNTFLEKARGQVVLTATDKTSAAWEGEHIIGGLENSLFTHFVIEGIRNGIGANEKGFVTVDTLYSYVHREVVAAAAKQHPRKFEKDREGEFVIARYPYFSKLNLLDPVLIEDLKDPRVYVRIGVIDELARLLNGTDKEMALAARELLEQIKNDEEQILRVANAAIHVLKTSTKSDASLDKISGSKSKRSREKKADTPPDDQSTIQDFNENSIDDNNSHVQKSIKETVASESTKNNIFKYDHMLTLSGHTKMVRTLIFSPDSKLLASGSGGVIPGDNTVRLWDTSNGKVLRRLKGAKSPITKMVFSPDGAIIIASTFRSLFSIDKEALGNVYVWRVADGRLMRTFEGKLVSMSPDGKKLAISKNGISTELWSFSNWEKLYTLEGSVGTFSPDSTKLALGPESQTMNQKLGLHRVSDGGLLHKIDGNKILNFSPDGSFVVSSFKEENASPKVLFWHVSDGALAHSLDGSGGVFSPDGEMFAIELRAVNKSPTVQIIHRISDWTPQYMFKSDAVEFSPNAAMFAIKSQKLHLQDGVIDRPVIQLRRSSDGELLGVNFDHEENVNRLTFSPNGNFFATSEDKIIRLWDIGNIEE